MNHTTHRCTSARSFAAIALAFFCVLFLPRSGAAQGENLIINGSFETPVIDNGSCVGGRAFEMDANFIGWQPFWNTPDVQWEDCNRDEKFGPSPAGRQWIFLRSGSGDGYEAMTQRLQQPLKVGSTYDLTFLGITRRPFLRVKGKVNIYLSQLPFTVNTFRNQRRVWGDQSNEGKLNRRTKRWHTYQTDFVADAPYEYILITSLEGMGENNVGIDDVRLTERGNCNGNLATNASLEDLREATLPRNWISIFGNYDNWYCAPARGGCDEDAPDIISTAHSGGAFSIIRSKQQLVNENSALGSQLGRPMVTGQRYRLSFYAATKAPLLVQKGEVRWMAGTSEIEWNNGDLTGTEIVPYTKILGSETAWRLYSWDFVAGQDYTHVAVQTGDGYHVAIDDICITDIPFRPGTIQFSSAEYSEQESLGPAQITFERVGGTQGVVSATFETVRTGGSAIPNTDYTPTVVTVTFQDGQVSATAPVPFINDIELEPDETVPLILRNATGGATLGLSTATLTIRDDFAGLVLPPPGFSDPLQQGRVVWVSNRNAQGTLSAASSLFTKGVRSSLGPRIVPNTEGASNPVWSYDGRYIAFNKTITRQVLQGSLIATVTEQCIQVVDQTGYLYATYYPSTFFGVSNFGAPQWSADGTKIIFSYYNQLPASGIGYMQFSTPYRFQLYTSHILISDWQGRAALAPVFSPNGNTVYFHGAAQAPQYGAQSYLYSVSMSNPGLVVALNGNGTPVNHAFHATVHPDGSRLLYSSNAHLYDTYGIFEDDELMNVNVTTGADVRVTSESEDDWGSYAVGGLAAGQFIRHGDPLGDNHRNLALQHRDSVRIFGIADSTSASSPNTFDDRTPSWVIPKMNTWDFDTRVTPPNVTLTWKSIRIDPVEGQTFKVERSVDRENWGVIGEVSRGTILNLEQTFQFIDPFAFGLGVPVVYYRLALIDSESQDGYTYSYPLEVCLNCPQLPGESLE